MKFSVFRYVLGYVFLINGFFMSLPPLIVSLIYNETQGKYYCLCGLISIILGFLFIIKQPKETKYYFRDSLFIVFISWVILSIIGCIPFVLTKEIPKFHDALFEVISGFTTTGSSILKNVEFMSNTSIFWRSFTHWIGGMGVIIFLIMIIPIFEDRNLSLMKAESPGPFVEKLVPHIKDTAKYLYLIYLVITLLEMILLIMVKMPVFDSIIISFGTAGTGGFSLRSNSLVRYTSLQQNIVTFFMFLFSVNFGFYFLLINKKFKKAFKLEEVKYYFFIILTAIIFISFNVNKFYGNIFETIKHTAFQVVSIISTTGFCTTDFNKWPLFSKLIIILIMFIGACAGSTGGGLKVSRILLIGKAIKNKFKHIIHPKSIRSIKYDNTFISDKSINNIFIFVLLYLCVFIISVLLISLNNFSFMTSFSAVATTINNVGPGFDLISPLNNFSSFSVFSKYVLMFDMLIGRLELYPILISFILFINKIKKK